MLDNLLFIIYIYAKRKVNISIADMNKFRQGKKSDILFKKKKKLMIKNKIQFCLAWNFVHKDVNKTKVTNVNI